MINRYEVTIRGSSLDVYDILKAYKVTDHAIAHALKKLLMAGKRGLKSESQDILEAKQAIGRYIGGTNIMRVDYAVIIQGSPIDIDDILKAYKITDPNISNAIELLLTAGKRGIKSENQDILEAEQAIERFIEEQI